MSETSYGTVWVIGASSGIGESFARLIDGEAEHVAISARSADKLETIASEGRNLTAFPLDVTSPEALAQTARTIEERFGGIDLVVVCSGLWWIMRSDELEIAKMHDAMDVNFFGAVNTVNAVLPGMKARGRGHIVLVASVAGYRGLPNAAAYGPTKAALMNLSETLKLDLRRFGVDVSVVNPGFVDTPMTRTNTFKMPGLIDSDLAAEKMLAGIRKKTLRDSISNAVCQQCAAPQRAAKLAVFLGYRAVYAAIRSAPRFCASRLRQAAMSRSFLFAR